MQAFEGIRILDFTHVYAGPFTTYQFAVMGAEVIKIEPTDNPDMMRNEGVDAASNEIGLGSTYLFNNQGKKAISLNLATEEGQGIARKLIETADVLVENYSSGLDKYGLGSKQALEINPQLIYCNMSAYGPDNEFAGRPAFDPVIQAMSGMMSVNGEPDQPFIRVGPPLIDYGTGAQAAFAISSALFQRSRTGKGQVIHVNMLDAALVMMSPILAGAMQSGETEKRTGNGHNSRPGYAVYTCQGGDLMIGAFTPRHHQNLFDAMTIWTEIEQPESIDSHWLGQNGEKIRYCLSQKFSLNTADHWEVFLNSHDLPAAKVRDQYEMLKHDQPRRAWTSQHQRIPGNEMTVPISAFTFAESGPALDTRCARHGEDTNSVLGELGFSKNELDQLRESGIIF
jgi:crotonobetainyl-CoA:carnitine CoA-transferase CaiB-like acyl-CoA transferase